ncbi:DUF3221 domain-containing protein [Texcoconibacillus texcoconensis]|uniref:DUF3221 domain-containing protein n=1 Tax=Texcoconibacillus texcoconensis TaxID=1095777 RepID=A0A840QRE1_9BACI|nr:DUF3221 domain-containing protein [Texcoconibacillus texcoconensis]MBB5174032.1 hypothetical protein [Texcoconibacillus texcoconensis]
MKIYLFTFGIALLIFAVGCSSSPNDELDPSESNVQEGYVTEVSDERILLVSDIAEEEAMKLTEESLLDNGTGSSAVWYTVDDPQDYDVGQLLRVQYEVVLESYPGQSEALEVQIVEE